MRGFPFLRFTLVFFLFLGVGLALWRITLAPPATAPGSSPPAPAAPSSVTDLFQFTAQSPLPMDRLSLSAGGAILWEKVGPSHHMTGEFPLPTTGASLVCRAEFAPGERPLALRLRFRLGDGSRQEITLWGEGTTLEQVLPWNPPTP